MTYSDTTLSSSSEYPAAKLIFPDGSMIELDNETTKLLKQQFGG